MRLSHFFKGLSWLIGLNLLIKPLWIFGIDRQVQNSIGHEAYGAYFSILGLSYVLLFIADAGLTNMLNRQLAMEEDAAIKKLVGYKFALSLLYLVVLLSICWITGIQQWEIAVLVGGIQLTNSLLIFFRSVLTGYQAFTTDAWLSIVDKTLMILLCGALLYLPFATGLTLPRFLYLQLGCTVVSLIIAIYLVAKRNLPRSSGQSLRHMVQATLPFTLLILLMAVHSRLDVFLLERIHPNGAYEAGVYATAYRLLDAGNMLGYLLASFLVPFAARHLSEPQVIEPAVLRLRHGMVLVSIAVVTVTVVFAKPIMQLLYSAGDDTHAQVLTYCLAVLPAYYLIHIYGSLLTAKGLFRSFISIMLLAVVVNVILNIGLSRSFGALGCCLAALVSQYMCAALCFVSATRAYRLPYAWASIAGYGVAGVVLLLISYGLQTLLPSF